MCSTVTAVLHGRRSAAPSITWRSLRNAACSPFRITSSSICALQLENRQGAEEHQYLDQATSSIHVSHFLCYQTFHCQDCSATDLSPCLPVLFHCSTHVAGCPNSQAPTTNANFGGGPVRLHLRGERALVAGHQICHGDRGWRTRTAWAWHACTLWPGGARSVSHKTRAPFRIPPGCTRARHVTRILVGVERQPRKRTTTSVEWERAMP